MEILAVGGSLLNDGTFLKVAQKCGHGFDYVQTAADAIRVIKKRKVDLILMDTSLPDMKGSVLIGQMRRIIPHVKIIVTAESNFSELESADKDKKIDYYLIKPVDQVYLENVINHISGQVGEI